jgi:carotenoid cleavage dioxygenase-like enzyme
MPNGRALLAVGLCTTVAFSSEDVGYHRLYETANDEFDNFCAPSVGKAVPKYLQGGSFVIGSVGQQEMGDRHFVGFGDAFGKYTRFTVEDGQVCATYRMMRTGFYNNSVKAGTIAAGILFYETEPPRQCPAWNPLCNFLAPNDNTFVNTFMHDGQLLSLTDSHTMLVMDPVSLDVRGNKKWKDSGIEGKIPVSSSAHPEWNKKYNEAIDYVGSENPLTGATDIVIFGMSEARKESRKKYGATVTMKSAPYMHSYGVTNNYTILPRMPIAFSLPKIGAKSLEDSFKDIPLTEPSEDNGFFVVPMDGGDVIKKFLPIEEKLYFTHTVNAFEVPEKNEVVIDLTTTGSNPFASDLKGMDMVNKSIRDACYNDDAPCIFLVKRFHVPLGDGEIRSEAISDPTTGTDFTKMNDKYHGEKHCFYWGVEWFGDKKSRAFMSIVKYNLCGGHDVVATKRSWHKDNWYPSEPHMISNPDKDAAEDDGVIAFIALEGASEQTYFITLNASTMEEISMSGPYAPVAFTTHAQWFENMVPPRFSETIVV